MISTDELAPVEGTSFDLREPTAFGAHIDDANEQLKLGGGYDHNFVLAAAGSLSRPAAHVLDPVSACA